MIKYAHFLLPVVDGVIYVGQRNTEPHKGLYGPIGGKPEQHNPQATQHHSLVNKIGGSKEICIADKIAQIQGLESGANTAVREFGEEAFQRQLVSHEISDVLKLGGIENQYQDDTIICCTYLANVHTNAWNPNARELTNIRPVQDLRPNQVFPVARLAFKALRSAAKNHLWGAQPEGEIYHPMELDKQIHSDFDFEKTDYSTIVGTGIYISALGMYD